MTLLVRWIIRIQDADAYRVWSMLLDYMDEGIEFSARLRKEGLHI